MPRENASVDTPSVRYTEMARRWDLLEHLLGGTPSMRSAEHKYLPQHKEEVREEYDRRLKQSVLFPAYKDTLESITEKPMSKSIQVTGLPSSLEYLLQDADGFGSSLHSFATDMFFHGIHHGHAGIFVDFPSAPVGRSLQDEKELKLRPFFTLYYAPSIIGWKFDSIGRLSLVRFHETRIESDPDNVWKEMEVEYIRVIGSDFYMLYRKEPDDKEFLPVKSGDGDDETQFPFNFPGNEIPLSIFYSNRLSQMVSSPPLEDLGWINLIHWQSQSDQRNILSFARTGILFGKGFAEEEVAAGLVVGPTQAYLTNSPDAELKYVEHSGAAISSGRQDLIDLEEKMELLGLRPFAQRAKARTATERVISEDSSDTAIESWIREAENSILNAIIMAGQWLGVSDDEIAKISVDIHSEFSLGSNTKEEAEILGRMLERGVITKKTYFLEMQRRNIVDSGLIADTEITLAGEEAALPMPDVGVPEGSESGDE